MKTTFSANNGVLLQAIKRGSRLRIVGLSGPFRPTVQLVVGGYVLAQASVPGRMTESRRQQLKTEWRGQTEGL